MLNIQITSSDPDPSRQGQGGAPLILHTTRGDLRAAYHESPAPHAGVVWVWGAYGGLEGPADGLYARLADQLTPDGITSLRVDYRQPRVLMESVMDTLAGVSFLKAKGYAAIALVGHSFGGAVVITAAPLSPEVKAVVALSSQTGGAQNAGLVSPRPLLLVHGEADTRLPPQASRTIYLWARQPKELVLYPGAGHSLTQCKEKLDALLKRWLVEKLLV
ncbi:MAG: dienelactone hydrolase family protein [Chloroflexi bacterium]|nr:dienelactone hydrolase family protein [Chloroflexota bacterium]